MIEGYGEMYFETGKVYKGHWHKNRMCGKGVMHLEDGRVYEGRMKNDEFNGYGIMTYPDGTTYEGEWKHGMKWGKGFLKVRNERLGQNMDLKGCWENGELIHVEAN